jgi:uncharacterized protein YjiS (DUF1127 family)
MTQRYCFDTSWSRPTNSAPNVFGPPAPQRLQRLMMNVFSRVRVWRERAHGRHLLLQLDDRMLRDVGLSRSDVDFECAKHFWQP